MKNADVARVLMLGSLFFVVSLLQACVPVASGVIAYESSISAQQHAAYTEYLFAIQASNNTCQQRGEAPVPIVPEKEWINNTYKPRLEYAAYYSRQISSNAPVHSFEVWKEVDQPIEEANDAARSHRPSR